MASSLQDLVEQLKGRWSIPDYITIASTHSYNCTCDFCFLYWADIGTIEEHGAFNIAVLNAFRERENKPPFRSENDQVSL